MPTTSALIYKQKVANEIQKSLSLETQVIGTNSELDNLVRQIQRDQIRSKLIQNLVIRAHGGDFIGSTKQSSSEHNIIVPKISTLPESKSNESNESNDLDDDDIDD